MNVRLVGKGPSIKDVHKGEGVCHSRRLRTWGRGGLGKCGRPQNFADVFYGRPLRSGIYLWLRRHTLYQSISAKAYKLMFRTFLCKTMHSNMGVFNIQTMFYVVWHQYRNATWFEYPYVTGFPAKLSAKTDFTT